MKKNGLDVYEVEFDDLISIFNNVSIVTMPAIEESFIKLSKTENEIKMKVDDEKHIISGPVLIPEQLIIRVDASGHKYYIKWSKETIEQVAINFFKNHRNTEGNVEHQFSVNGVTFFESFLLNKERGIAPVEFKDLPDGTWIMSAKITNEDVWNAIKSGELTGFSIDMSNVGYKETKEIDSIEELLEYLKNNK